MLNSGQFQKGQRPWNFGKKASIEAKQKMSMAKLGKKRGPNSEEHNRKLSVSNTGQKRTAETCEKMRIAKSVISKETRQKMREAKLGNKASDETKLKMSVASKGKPQKKGYKLSLETRKRMSESRRGEKSCRWKGGITPQNKLIRASAEYALWRESVFVRDDYTCVACGIRGCVLNAHHIKPFATHPYLRFAIDNGSTLCEPCHRNVHFYKEAE